MERDALAPMAIGAFVVAAIAAGLTITGGPLSARAEKRDMARLADLRKLQAAVTCRTDQDKGLPDDLTAASLCDDAAPLSNPVTGESYKYEKLSETTYRLCAEFERPELMTDFDLGSAQWQSADRCFVVIRK
ncbi:hypothetical protein [Aliiroseovarius sp. F47248L]|uniref:hypothetical protein n=1 Tax=Aliiroseovarius sp. F47248L TaxID=2926420 RepID=UPI001FF426FD|nr:hypothetical protein [Aliiroseovarius sp. F47248L]MCK0139878.1 hypothetical protein [Aliiroseovarius sp. F47248L]